MGLTGVAALVALWYVSAPAGATRAAVPTTSATTGAAGVPLAQAGQLGRASSAPLLPLSLEGSTPPRLPLDARGHLRKTRAVREFFDYFLTAQNEWRGDALDALVKRQIAAQLDGTTAQTEALDVWQRYAAYRHALATVAPLSAPAPGGGWDLDVIRSALAERASLASRTIGGDWSEVFFGADWRRAGFTIERLQIVRDPALTDAQKTARLSALDESVPAEERAAAASEQRAREAVDRVAELEHEGGTTDELRGKATQALGRQAAERIVKLRQEDGVWQTKYADYVQQRARIAVRGLSPAERDAQIEQLRRRVFASSAGALRAASLDGTLGH